MSDDKTDGAAAPAQRLDEEPSESTEREPREPSGATKTVVGRREEDRETILMALDQISQTIDVMTSVVGRLRHHVEEQEHTREAEIRDAMRPGRVLH